MLIFFLLSNIASIIFSKQSMFFNTLFVTMSVCKTLFDHCLVTVCSLCPNLCVIPPTITASSKVSHSQAAENCIREAQACKRHHAIYICYYQEIVKLFTASKSSWWFLQLVECFLIGGIEWEGYLRWRKAQRENLYRSSAETLITQSQWLALSNIILRTKLCREMLC